MFDEGQKSHAGFPASDEPTAHRTPYPVFRLAPFSRARYRPPVIRLMSSLERLCGSLDFRHSASIWRGQLRNRVSCTVPMLRRQDAARAYVVWTRPLISDIEQEAAPGEISQCLVPGAQQVGASSTDAAAK